MERNGDCLLGDNSHPKATYDGETSVLSSSLFLDNVGEVVLTHNSDGLSWKPVDSSSDEGSVCWRAKFFSISEIVVKFSDIYAVELIDWGTMHEYALASAGDCLLGHSSEMYRFSVHSIEKSKSNPSLWSAVVYIFGHKNLQTCQMWVHQIKSSLDMEPDRPKSLMVFVHPKSGKGTGRKTWEAVVPIFSQANVKTKVTVTERAGHAFDVMTSMTNRELNSYDGVVAVGGDGLFNEILNGLLLSRHKATYPTRPADSNHSVENNGSVNNADGNKLESSGPNEDHSPLLMNSGHNGSRAMSLRSEDNSFQTETDPDFSLPHEWFRFGIIPAGSTDAIVICTTGARDPLTSALHIILGKRVSLDIAQIVRWKMTSASKDEPYVRYAATFAGYGFYGDVITESEKYRWMGPKRYDYAGTKVFLQHRSYEAEVAYLEVDSENTGSSRETGHWIERMKAIGRVPKQSNQGVCCAKCSVCNKKPIQISAGGQSSVAPYLKQSRWVKSRGRFHSVGAAVISCRNERAPDGLVADAHLSDGFLHLIMVKECPRALYLWHLTEIARKGGNPLDFQFVEHHKTPTFMFTSYGKQSAWNVDGEILQAHQLSAQVFQGLVSIYATGPEV